VGLGDGARSLGVGPVGPLPGPAKIFSPLLARAERSVHRCGYGYGSLEPERIQRRRVRRAGKGIE